VHKPQNREKEKDSDRGSREQEGEKRGQAHKTGQTQDRKSEKKGKK
jgi:hypothetical protein